MIELVSRFALSCKLRPCIKNSSQQMSDKVGRSKKKKNRYSSSEAGPGPWPYTSHHFPAQT